ncbi:MAG: RecX family transcriptional regulator [Bacteroidales bacterium]|nr:RecX family transcriptional regulator [Bacteroidales bacterium]
MPEPRTKLTETIALMQRYCSMREYCESDIRKKLKARGCDTDECDIVIKKLVDERFIDEERYCRAFVRDKSSLSGWGSRKIEFALRSKAIDTEIIKSAMESLDPEAGGKVLERVIKRKLEELIKRRVNSEEDKAKIRESVIRFALTRGFTYDEILKVISKTMANFEAGKK